MLRYKELHGYKYRVELEESVYINILFQEPVIGNRYLRISRCSVPSPGPTLLSVKEGYLWDGPSGPTIDDQTNMRASLVHDVLYQAMREDLISRELYRKAADQELRRLMIEDGLAWLKNSKTIIKDTPLNRAWVRTRAQAYYVAVRLFGKKSSMPEKNPRGKIVEIP